MVTHGTNWWLVVGQTVKKRLFVVEQMVTHGTILWFAVSRRCDYSS